MWRRDTSAGDLVRGAGCYYVVLNLSVVIEGSKTFRSKENRLSRIVEIIALEKY